MDESTLLAAAPHGIRVALLLRNHLGNHDRCALSAFAAETSGPVPYRPWFGSGHRMDAARDTRQRCGLRTRASGNGADASRPDHTTRKSFVALAAHHAGLFRLRATRSKRGASRGMAEHPPLGPGADKNLAARIRRQFPPRPSCRAGEPDAVPYELLGGAPSQA